jgi:3-oxoacyl-(acyl-carrier-protein) synthase III
LRDIGLHLFWVNRFTLTMYLKRPTRWRDVPRSRDDVYVSRVRPWTDAERKIAAVERAFVQLPTTWDDEVERQIFDLLFDVLRHKRHEASVLAPIKPTVAAFLGDPDSQTFVLSSYDPDYPIFRVEEIVDCTAPVAELEALLRWSMVIHNQYPWGRAETRLARPAEIGDDDFVVLLYPRDQQVQEFIRRVKGNSPARQSLRAEPGALHPLVPCRPLMVREQCRVLPRLESIVAIEGECTCSNDDLIRNSSFSWSPMSSAEITAKTGIESRAYTRRNLEDLSLDAARGALRQAGRDPGEVGAVVFCSCTSDRVMPSMAAWITGQLGLYQTHGSFDVIAACAGFPYGMAEAVRLLQEVNRPVLVVCAEKFSNKIGNVRTSRMLFGDGAAAMVVAPSDTDGSNVDVVQIYAGGTTAEVNAVVWPNPAFDNQITVHGPGVRSFVERYLVQMLSELGRLPDERGGLPRLLDAIELIVPHQANKSMLLEIAGRAGVRREQLYFNVARVGNLSAASIPVALRDAVRDGTVSRPTRVFAPGFGAGATAGYVVFELDPAIVALGGRVAASEGEQPVEQHPVPTDDAQQLAFV